MPATIYSSASLFRNTSLNVSGSPPEGSTNHIWLACMASCASDPACIELATCISTYHSSETEPAPTARYCGKQQQLQALRQWQRMNGAVKSVINQVFCRPQNTDGSLT